MGSLEGDQVMLMPIGRFARASRLSVKSLRNYDESGLLPAAYVDQQSGYRYYRLEQLARADAIRSLRMVSMPLSQIAETLDGDDAEAMLMSHLAALEHQRDELNRQVLELQRRINLKEFVMSTEVTIKPAPALTVALWRTSTTHTGIYQDIPTGFGKVMSYMGGRDLDPIGAPFTMYFQAPDGDTIGDIAMAVPVAAEPEVDGEIEIAELPACVEASVIHRGSYDNMGESYATVAAWVQHHGHQIVGPTREVYLNDPSQVDEAELLTEILFPIDADGVS